MLEIGKNRLGKVELWGEFVIEGIESVVGEEVGSPRKQLVFKLQGVGGVYESGVEG
jgi:hypothetical protein